MHVWLDVEVRGVGGVGWCKICGRFTKTEKMKRMNAIFFVTRNIAIKETVKVSTLYR
jgi:hypothetical protein